MTPIALRKRGLASRAAAFLALSPAMLVMVVVYIGCTTWTMPMTENGVTHQALFWCSMQVGGNPLVNNKAYPRIVEDFRAGFAKAKIVASSGFGVEKCSASRPNRKLECGLAKKTSYRRLPHHRRCYPGVTPYTASNLHQPASTKKET